MPLAVAYREGVVYVVEYTGSKVSYINLEGKTVYNPDKMTVKDLKAVLKDLKLWQGVQGGAKSAKKKDLQQTLSSWIATKRNRLNEELASSEMPIESSYRTSSGSRQKGALILRNGVKEPTALHFHVNGTLFITDQSTKSVLHVRLMFNGVDIRASSLQSIGCHTQVFGLMFAQNDLFVASSCTESGGLFR